MIKAIQAEEVKQTGALALVWRVFKEFEAPEYTEEGVREFRKFIAPQTVKQKMSRAELLLWAYWDAGNIAGVITLRPPCHVALLFVDRPYHRRGIAKKLYGTVLEYTAQNTDCRAITVHSSPYAVEVYQRLGFIKTDAEQTVNGLRFTPMQHTFR